MKDHPQRGCQNFCQQGQRPARSYEGSSVRVKEKDFENPLEAKKDQRKERIAAVAEIHKVECNTLDSIGELKVVITDTR